MKSQLKEREGWVSEGTHIESCWCTEKMKEEEEGGYPTRYYLAGREMRIEPAAHSQATRK